MFELVIVVSTAVLAAEDALIVVLAAVKAPPVRSAVFWISRDCAALLGKYHEAMRCDSLAPNPGAG